MDCSHNNFQANAEVNRLTDVDADFHVIGFMLDLTIYCSDCQQPFRFLGLPMGYDSQGASVSANGCEARLAILPV